jgi:hypothetical protein
MLYNAPYQGIYYKSSTDGGSTWEPSYQLFPYPSPSSFHVAVDLKENAHVVFVNVPPGGSRGEIYYKQWTSSQGVEEYAVPSPVPRLPFSSRPNPFVSYTAVRGYATERFGLYDVSGRKVGVYKGDRIGEGLSAGVYFLRPFGEYAKPLRIVKLR